MGISMFDEEEAMKQTPEIPPAAHTDIVPDTNTYTHTNTLSRPVTPGFVILFFAFVLLPFALYYAYQWSKAGTTINTTITENDDLESGLVLHYTFDGREVSWSTDSATTTDRSGNGYDGTYYGFGPTQDVDAGRIGQSLTFKNRYITVGDVNAVDSLTAATFCAWMKHTAISDDDPIINKYSGVSGFKFFRDETTTGKRDVYSLFLHSDQGDIATVESAASSTPQGRWVHVCGSFVAVSATGLKLFIDGSLVSTASASLVENINAGTEDLEIGLGFDGSMDDVRIYNRAISASEVKRLYEQGATTHINTTIDTNDDLENGLVGHWTFDGPNMNISSGTREVLDISGDGNHGDWTNHATTTIAGKIGQALSFDGSNDYVNVNSSATLDNLSQFTVSVWIKPNSFADACSGYIQIVQKNQTCNAATDGWQLLLSSTNAIEFGSSFFSQNLVKRTAANFATLNQWQHIVLTWDGTESASNIHIYRDTVEASYALSQDGDFAGRNSEDPGRPLQIGSLTGSGTFGGSIDDVRIYNRVLSIDEMKRIYDLGVATKINTTIDTNDDLENGLVGHWTFDGSKMAWGSSTAEVLDSSASSIEGDMVNMDQSAAIAGKMGQAVKLGNGASAVNLGSPSIYDNLNRLSTSMWVRVDSLPTGPVPLLNKGTDYNSFGWSFMLYPAFLNWYRDFSISDGYWSTPYEIREKEWVHLLMTYDNSHASNTPYFYINGVSATATTDLAPRVSTTTDASYDLIVGNDSGFDSAGVGMTIDDVRLYNRILSPNEARRLYQLGGGR